MRSATPTRSTARPRAPRVTASVTVAVLIIVAVLLGLDPIAQFYTWLGGISSVGIVLLLVLTSVAVLAIFRRNPHGLGRWKTRVAPGLGLIGLVDLHGAGVPEPARARRRDVLRAVLVGHHRAVRRGVRARPDRRPLKKNVDLD